MVSPLNAEIADALQRVEKAQVTLINAKRRLSRSEEAAATARRDVTAAEEESRVSSTALETLISKNIRTSIKKGGAKMAVAIGEVMSRLLEEGDGLPSQGELPVSAPDAGRPAKEERDPSSSETSATASDVVAD